MGPRPVIADSAHKHGIEADDMIHAFDNAMDAYDLGDGFGMLLGPARDGQLLEIGYISSTDAHISSSTL